MPSTRLRRADQVGLFKAQPSRPKVPSASAALPAEICAKDQVETALTAGEVGLSGGDEGAQSMVLGKMRKRSSPSASYAAVKTCPGLSLRINRSRRHHRRW